MKPGRVQVAVILAPLVAGVTTGCDVGADAYCSGVYSEYLRQAEGEALHEEEAAAAKAGGPGLGWLEDQEEAAIAARAARLHVVLENDRCFTPGDVSRARVQLAAVQEQLGP
jgi:hypothetical protein